MNDDKFFSPADGTLSPIERRRLRFRKIPIRVILPNLVTLLALAMGLTAIRYAVEGKFETAVLAVMAAAVLDGLDGRLARALKGTTRFGAELDSLADFVDFGVAPGLLLYFWALHNVGSFGWFATLAFAIAAALRLARFNVMAEEPGRPAWQSGFFVGMPSPAGAVTVLLPLYLHLSVLEVPASKWLAPVFVLYQLAIAFLMASRIPHFSGKRLPKLERDQVIPLLFAAGVALVLLATYPMEMLAALSLCYLGSIPFGMRRYRELAREEAEKVAGKSAPPA
ncbi:MAG TPA: CDP-diacylglycerol--serine O-phosphatidyltransferase [Methylocystis sp.]|nr:CDP-diacylglycerol--serine O-phosphatidyltransferase [Methylocystis sp.]